MRRLLPLAGLAFGAPAVCLFTYTALSVCLVMLAVPQLPAWARGPVVAWIFDRPQETYASVPTVSIPDTGYSGLESFQCLLPPIQGYLSDPFGAVRPGGWVHQGIDYGTYHEEVDVRTPFGGQVAFAGWLGPFGNLVVIENAGYRVYLAHHSVLYVFTGQLVVAGDMVGLSGSTGNSTGIHVHMEIRVWDGAGWVAVDPYSVLLPGQAGTCDWYSLALPPEP